MLEYQSEGAQVRHFLERAAIRADVVSEMIRLGDVTAIIATPDESMSFVVVVFIGDASAKQGVGHLSLTLFNAGAVIAESFVSLAHPIAEWTVADESADAETFYEAVAPHLGFMQSDTDWVMHSGHPVSVSALN